jgi:plastocyanin
MLLSWAVAASPAEATNYDVGTTAQNRFSPDLVTATVGDTVTWTNTSSSDFHNVHFDDGLFDDPPEPVDGKWSVYRTFTAPGTFTYYCEAHKDLGMTGTVVVNAAPPGGGGGGSGGGSPPPPADTAPVSSLLSASKQRIAKLFVRASMNEAGTLSATGTVSAPGAAKVYRFKRTSRSVAANQRVKLRLKLSSKALKRVKHALGRGKKLRAKVVVTAIDLTGHKTLRKQTIRLRR